MLRIDATEAKQVLEREFDRLTEKGGGLLTATSVVDAARSPKSPLHKYFEWDDSLAAANYRLDQARVLIRSVRVAVTVEDDLLFVPRFVHNANPDEREAGYCELLAISDDERKLNVILSELQTGMAHLRRAGNIALAIENKQLHGSLVKQVAQIEAYLQRIARK